MQERVHPTTVPTLCVQAPVTATRHVGQPTLFLSEVIKKKRKKFSMHRNKIFFTAVFNLVV